MKPRCELQAVLAVQIIATGFAGLRFLRQSHRQMTEDYINVYGGYAIKLLRLQNEMVQTFDRYRRGNKQTVEVRHVHIHSGAQGVVGIINPPDDREGAVIVDHESLARAHLRIKALKRQAARMAPEKIR
jgi:hypothetical protein